MITLSKTLDPADFAQLEPELAIVDQHFTRGARAQHPMRRWEYAMALDAMSRWLGPAPWGKRRPYLVDVGGGGSPFRFMAGPSDAWRTPHVIDPEENYDLATHLSTAPALADVVTCISVIEHVEDLDQFCYHLSCLVAPSGLLFLTMDYCDGFAEARHDALHDYHVPDTYDLHWMRERIFNQFTLKQLANQFLRRDFTLFGGGFDLIWHGPQVSDYTFASLALVKRS